MNRDEMLEDILDKLEQLAPDEKEEILVVLQIVKGETPDNQEAALRVKRRVMEWQKKGYSVDDTLSRYFAG